MLHPHSHDADVDASTKATTVDTRVDPVTGTRTYDETRASTTTSLDAPVIAAERSADANVVPEVVEVQENPAIVRQTVQKTEREEIQPVIERERETAEIQPVIRPMHETVHAPTKEINRELPAENREYRGEMTEAETRRLNEIRTRVGEGQTVVKEGVFEGTTVRPPIVHETVRPHVIEQIQPVIEQEVIAPTTIHTTKPIHEHIVEAPVVREAIVEPVVERASAVAATVGPAVPADRSLMEANMEGFRDRVAEEQREAERF